MSTTLTTGNKMQREIEAYCGSDEPDLLHKTTFLLMTMINTCRNAVLDTLGPAARGAAWWTGAAS